MTRLATWALFLWAVPPATDPASRVVVVVNKANETDGLPFDTVRKIFLLEKTFWKDSKPIRVLAQESSNESRKLVLEKIYKMDERKYKKYWQLKIFKGEVSSAPLERTEEQIVKEVAQEESALGYLSAASFDKLPPETKAKLKVLRIDGKSHTDAEYLLVQAQRPD